MRTVIDGKTDLRPYNSNDTSSTPLPYVQSYITLSTTSVGAKATVSEEITATDWGAGLDFYLLSMRWARSNPVEMPGNEGFLIKLTIKETGELLYVKTFQKDESEIYTYVDGDGHLQFNHRLRISRRVLSTQTITVDIENWTDNTFTGVGNTFLFYLFGMVV